ncbi:MAG TPA: hypothetical protein PLX89_18005, partial [Verrucomicrobiota bacterium]|nr:hypothetical protein [Verrucomicrobiota bacterium]
MGGQACVFYGAAEFSRDTPERALFWLREARTPGLLVELARQFPLEAAALAAGPRPLLHAALRGDEAGLESGLAEEERAKRAADRTYWIALKQELERMRHA